MTQLKTLIISDSLKPPSEGCENISLPNLHLSRCWLDGSSSVQKWLVSQEHFLRQGTTTSISLSNIPSIQRLQGGELDVLISELHHQFSAGSRKVLEIYSQDLSTGLNLDQENDSLLVIVYGLLTDTEATNLKTGEGMITVRCDNFRIVSAFLAILLQEADLDYVRIFNIGCTRHWGPLRSEEDDTKMTAIFGRLENVQHPDIRGNITSIEKCLTNSPLSRLTGNVLETLRISTPKSCRKPFKRLSIPSHPHPRRINTIILGSQSESTVEFMSRYANRVIDSDTREIDKLDNPLATGYQNLVARMRCPLDDYWVSMR